jgi:hypothetical protein
MGGRTATILIVGSACAAVLVMVWSSLAALSLADATPYWLGSLGIVCALGAALLIFKDLVLWPVRFLMPRLGRLSDLVSSWLRSLMSPRSGRSEGGPRPSQAPSARRRH